MLSKIKGLIGTNQFIATSDIFPRIDTKRIKQQLNLVHKGKTRGIKDLPESDSKSFDSVENEIIATVRNLRDICIRVYNEHKTVYNERQIRVTTARTEIDSSASQAPSEYMGVTQDLKTQLQESTVRLRECTNWKSKFRYQHNIDRACHHYSSNRLWWLALALFMVFIESILNGYLFAQKNQFGLLGGGFAALIISVANVGFSSLVGFYSRFINHIKLLTKIFGYILLLGWIVIILVFNFGVAHFRDGIEANLKWDAAAEYAVTQMYTAPLALLYFESWVLVLFGCLISVIALLKGYYADDPYPGYGNVERELDKARNNFTYKYEDAIKELTDKKDEMVEDLREAEERIRDDTKNLIDGLFGNTSLDSQFTLQLSHCDDVVNQLLQVYRESNKESRSTPSPEHFSKEFQFEEIVISKTNEINKDKLITGLDRIERKVTKAVKEINSLLGEAIKTLPGASEIEEEESIQSQGVKTHKEIKFTNKYFKQNNS